MNTRDTAGTILTTTAVLCAVITTGLLVRRELVVGRTARSHDPVPLENYQAYAVGHYFGPPNAPIKVVEFSDFQCPFCKRFADETWHVVQNRFPNDVALIYRHWPLPMHRNAYAAARAAECAGEQGRFPAFHDLLFLKQDSIGTKPYTEFAVEARVPDIPAFNACNAKTERVAAIERDIAAARELNAHGTPTIIVNDREFPFNPSTDELVSLIQEELRKRQAREH